jgi:hypothetical protein
MTPLPPTRSSERGLARETTGAKRTAVASLLLPSSGGVKSWRGEAIADHRRTCDVERRPVRARTARRPSNYDEDAVGKEEWAGHTPSWKSDIRTTIATIKDSPGSGNGVGGSPEG